jgi:hypothetical protein
MDAETPAVLDSVFPRPKSYFFQHDDSYYESFELAEDLGYDRTVTEKTKELTEMSMSETLLRAVAKGFRSFAEEVERDYPTAVPEAVQSTAPGQPGSPETMRHVLRAVADINQREHRGVTQSEMSQIARDAGMDPRGTAGYYAPDANLLNNRTEGRFITNTGIDRLGRLEELLGD